jgi:hypothetical protein
LVKTDFARRLALEIPAKILTTVVGHEFVGHQLRGPCAL